MCLFNGRAVFAIETMGLSSLLQEGSGYLTSMGSTLMLAACALMPMGTSVRHGPEVCSRTTLHAED